MGERLADLILDEGKWFAASMTVALLVAVLGHLCRRRAGAPRRIEVPGAMSLFNGCVLAVMGSGHLLAVGVKQGRGELEGAPLLLYPLGLVLALPGWWLVRASWRGPAEPDSEHGWRRLLLRLNVWLGLALLGAGLHNATIAAPAGLNVGHLLLERRPQLARVVAVVAVLVYLALFALGVSFAASGQTFEQFRGLE
jgi:hypothetical protein